MEAWTDYRLKDEDGRVARLIRELVLAGTYREAIRLDAYLARGFGPFAERHSQAARRLSDEICATASRSPDCAAARAPNAPGA